MCSESIDLDVEILMLQPIDLDLRDVFLSKVGSSNAYQSVALFCVPNQIVEVQSRMDDIKY
jgi:hypothetical protein